MNGPATDRHRASKHRSETWKKKRNRRLLDLRVNFKPGGRGDRVNQRRADRQRPFVVRRVPTAAICRSVGGTRRSGGTRHGHNGQWQQVRARDRARSLLPEPELKPKSRVRPRPTMLSILAERDPLRSRAAASLINSPPPAPGPSRPARHEKIPGTHSSRDRTC